MVYSQTKVIAGGIAHIPIVISVFYFVMTSFNKRALEFAEANKSIKLNSNELESEAKTLTAITEEREEVKGTEEKEEKAKAIKELSNKLVEIENKAEDVKEKVKKEKKKKKKKKKKDMKRD